VLYKLQVNIDIIKCKDKVQVNIDIVKEDI